MFYLQKPSMLLFALSHRGFFHFLSDKKYLSIAYKSEIGQTPNLDSPKTFNEKLSWLKINYHNPICTVMADKYWAKQYVAKIIGKEYIVPCYGRWDRVEDINFDLLPDKFFLKTNQDSSGGVIVDKKKGIDYDLIKKTFSPSHLKKNWYWHRREWVYKHIESCILAEEFLDEGTGHELHDYKFWCFNGKPLYMYITNKGSVVKENFYDMDFNPVMIDHGFERCVPEFSKPAKFEEMKELASKISEGIPFIRVDFFCVNDKIYFSENTFYDWGGLRPFGGNWDMQLGKLLDISAIK